MCAAGRNFATIVGALDHWSQTRPEAVAYSVDEREIVYAQLRQDALSLARSLRERGVGAGDRCGIVMPSGLDVFRALYATLYLRAWPVLFNPEAPAHATLRRMKSVDCRLALHAGDDGIDWRAAGQAAEAGNLPVCPAEELRAGAQSPLTPPCGASPDDVALLALTSGTTGEPKAAMILHRNLIQSFRSNWEFMQMREDDVFAGWSPHFLSMGVIRFVYYPMYCGLPAHLTPPSASSMIQWLRTISRTRATVTGGTDYGYRMAARLVRPETVDLRSLRYAFIGAEASRIETIWAFENSFGLSGLLRPNYGLTEASNAVANVRLGEEIRLSEEGRVSSGRAVPGVEIRIANGNGKPLAPGEQGEILVRGAQIFAGYFDDPVATEEIFQNGWLRTGDIGKLDKNGWLYVLGREKALIKRAGAAVLPSEAELAAKNVPGVLEAVALGLPSRSQEGLDDVVLVCETNLKISRSGDGVENPSMAISEAMKAALGFAPADVILVAPGQLPRDPNGKVRRAELRGRLLRLRNQTDEDRQKAIDTAFSDT